MLGCWQEKEEGKVGRNPTHPYLGRSVPVVGKDVDGSGKVTHFRTGFTQSWRCDRDWIDPGHEIL